MNNIALIKRLESIKKNDDYFYGLELLINELKAETMENDSFKTKSVKQRTKKALTLLKNFGGRYKTRPVLNYAAIQNGVQYFTDSYRAFGLMEHLELPNVENTNYTYPDMKRLFPLKENGKLLENFDYNYYINGHKTKLFNEDIATYKNDDVEIRFQASYIKDMCEVLGTINLECYYYGDLKPLLFVNPLNNDTALILPCRKY